MGSIPQLAYSYVQLFGLTTDKEYIYSSGYYGDTDPCEFDPDKMTTYATLRGFESLPKNDQVTSVSQLEQALLGSSDLVGNFVHKDNHFMPRSKSKLMIIHFVTFCHKAIIALRT